MTDAAKLLALLVHRGLVAAETAHAALRSGDIVAHLVREGACTSEQWQRWVATDADSRPVLSRYQLGELLGEGAVGRVFAATDRTNGQVLALKVMRAELVADQAKVEAFIREARLLMELSHPHLVKGLRVAREGETIFFAMERVPGECLQARLDRTGRIAEEEALRIVVQIAAALGALHERGLVHRDVKPGNILYAQERGAVLIDLGFAVARDQAPVSDTTAGTVHYIAPEQARGAALDVRADIYALGATLYHLTTGSLPFSGETSAEVLAKQVLESLSGARIRALCLSPQLHYFLEKMMAKEREFRFQDPAQLRAEVQAFLAQRQYEREQQQEEEQLRASGLRRNRERRRP